MKNGNLSPSVITPSVEYGPNGLRKSVRIATDAFDPIKTQQFVDKP
jgi:hypothetical protein